MKKNHSETNGYNEKSMRVENHGTRIIEDDGIIHFGSRLQTLIGEQSYRAFADKCGMSEKVIRNYVKGVTYPSLDRLSSIAKACDVSMEWLAFGSLREDKNAEGMTMTQEKSVQIQVQQSPDILLFMLNSITQEDRAQLITSLCNIGIKGVLQRLQQTPEQTESEEMAIRALPIRESLKDAVCMALAGNEETDREILRGIERRAQSRAAESGHTAEPETLTVKKTA
ncbi:helix-turn-helix transcriptional regulator [Edwardsiella hoshinae]|uniref:Helix-turn-helix n=2 Tax=Edwardsiella hoshinae TaxID=93378 RepID=A0A376DH09_9GAMM|nr:helix-turn-helix transcriptional regulator [Edwardsiella hoshinae]QPR26746.1 helix-turn-helix transcriptional regulator [Edwardsiella hoshinae]STC89533.1 Helix-turn-helix [Edwardsiella hoshinae]